MMLTVGVLARSTDWQLGSIFVIVGAVSTAVVLLWNIVWVNTVLFRITREEHISDVI